MALADTVSAQYLNQPVEVEDPSALDQCFDWAFLACDRMNIPRTAIRHGLAIQIWTLATDITRQYFDLVANTPAYVPPANALAVFGTQVGPNGHVAWVRSGSTKQNLLTSDENWNGIKRVEYVTHVDYVGVLGFLVPKALTPPAATGGVMEAIRPCNVHIAPNIESALGGSQHLAANTTFAFNGIVAGEVVNQNGVTTNAWARSTSGHYVWTGNLKQVA